MNYPSNSQNLDVLKKLIKAEFEQYYPQTQEALQTLKKPPEQAITAITVTHIWVGGAVFRLSIAVYVVYINFRKIYQLEEAFRRQNQSRDLLD